MLVSLEFDRKKVEDSKALYINALAREEFKAYLPSIQSIIKKHDCRINHSFADFYKENEIGIYYNLNDFYDLAKFAQIKNAIQFPKANIRKTWGYADNVEQIKVFYDDFINSKERKFVISVKIFYNPKEEEFQKSGEYIGIKDNPFENESLLKYRIFEIITN